LDTKWKNLKKTISFLLFFLGVSLTLQSAVVILKAKPYQTKLWELDSLFQEDYQQTGRFRYYITNRLKLFISMAANDLGSAGYDNNYYFNNSDYYNDLYDYYYGAYYNNSEIYSSLKDAIASDPEILGDMGYSEEELVEMLDGDAYNWPPAEMPSLSQEEKQKLIQRYHDSIKGDKNLLYSIARNGQVLYANWDLQSAEGSHSAAIQTGTIPTAPQGYNFLLVFDGEKVRIVKDGAEVDVYGDGVYREDSDWYVPGYENFQTDETLKGTTVCIAAAKDPVLYTEGTYGNGYRQLENALYWIHYNYHASRKQQLLDYVSLLIGMGLLLLSFLCRRSRREVLCLMAGFQKKVWFECKILLILGALLLLYQDSLAFLADSGYLLELRYAYEEGYGMEAMGGYLGRELLERIPASTYLALFWILYLLWNDIKYNRKIWTQSLTAKLYRFFSAKGLTQPLPRRIAKRNLAAFLSAALYGILSLGICLMGAASLLPAQAAVVLLSAVFLLFGFVICIIGRKNRETASDVETLSNRISDIRNGDYNACSPDALNGEKTDSQHDLSGVMAQLEDIRHGMKYAVDEQMKSERMKVELIANVSHDIKTPLTSIISYVQFLKEEKALPEHVKDYIAILDEKSQRLKNMIQDVFAVSKAASGELPMNMEVLDLGKLLQQTMADMQEEIEHSAVTFRTKLPDAPMLVRADGQRLYRVFQNLFQNAYQYSLSGSRVYVTLQAAEGRAVASVKNTSSLELDKGKDFTERFTRGDKSRTDGGSGLGLSIAQSFTEACGGAFHWETDADLFVVTVSFPIVDGNP